VIELVKEVIFEVAQRSSVRAHLEVQLLDSQQNPIGLEATFHECKNSIRKGLIELHAGNSGLVSSLSCTQLKWVSTLVEIDPEMIVLLLIRNPVKPILRTWRSRQTTSNFNLKNQFQFSSI
jgi:hypothetical protein